MTFIFLFSSHTRFFMVSLSFSSVPKIFVFDNLSTKAVGLRFFFCCKKILWQKQLTVEKAYAFLICVIVLHGRVVTEAAGHVGGHIISTVRREKGIQAPSCSPCSFHS